MTGHVMYILTNCELYDVLPAMTDRWYENRNCKYEIEYDQFYVQNYLSYMTGVDAPNMFIIK